MQCKKCGSDMWDNRNDKRNPNSPDYKCKDKECGNAVWLTKKDDPSRTNGFKSSKPYNKPAQNERESYWAEKAKHDKVVEPIIRRQHAQHMAVKLMADAGITTPEEADKILVPMINWFYDDAHGTGEYEVTNQEEQTDTDNGPLEI